jgi:hypothetical protein
MAAIARAGMRKWSPIAAHDLPESLSVEHLLCHLIYERKQPKNRLIAYIQ